MCLTWLHASCIGLSSEDVLRLSMKGSLNDALISLKSDLKLTIDRMKVKVESCKQGLRIYLTDHLCPAAGELNKTCADLREKVGSPSFPLDSIVHQLTNPNMSPVEFGSSSIFQSGSTLSEQLMTAHINCQSIKPSLRFTKFDEFSTLQNCTIYSQGPDSFCCAETYFTVPVCVSSGRNTTSPLPNLRDTIRSDVNGSRMTSLLALDPSKAFKNVIIKLDGQSACKLVCSYLTGRYQFAHINGVHSTTCRVYAGVHQYSVLWHLLFMLYVNDLPGLMHSNFCEPCLFAGDTFLLFNREGGDWKVLQEIINESLRQLLEWSMDNSLLINPTKSKAMLFGNTNRTYLPQCVKFRLAHALLMKQALYRLEVFADTTAGNFLRLSQIVNSMRNTGTTYSWAKPFFRTLITVDGLTYLASEEN
uniref:Reverse transcriptase domain-containing protein n=1 Tax=Glossina austeni TaxID=7395 RepID=A0A1A9V3K8_GLOAU